MKLKETLSRTHIRVPLVLALVTAFSALLISMVHMLTADRIRDNQLRAENAAVLEIFEDAYDIQALPNDQIVNRSVVLSVRVVYDANGNEMGRAITGRVFTTFGNDNGNITLVVGIHDNVLVGISVVALNQSNATYVNRVNNFIQSIESGLTGEEANRLSMGDANTHGSADAGHQAIITILRTAFLEYGYEPEEAQWVVEANLMNAIEMMFPQMNRENTLAVTNNWYVGDNTENGGFASIGTHEGRNRILPENLLFPQVSTNHIFHAGSIEVRNSADEVIGYVVITDGHARGGTNGNGDTTGPSQIPGGGNAADGNWAFRFAVGFSAAGASMIDFIPLHFSQTTTGNHAHQAPRIQEYLMFLRNSDIESERDLILNVDFTSGSTQGYTSASNALFAAFRIRAGIL